jgi:hypothetical protein
MFHRLNSFVRLSAISSWNSDAPAISGRSLTAYPSAGAGYRNQPSLHNNSTIDKNTRKTITNERKLS